MYIYVFVNYGAIIQRASVVQWLGFHPSKVEVRVRFTAVAIHSFHFFISLGLLHV
ncbi:hypothetical protein BJ878DRAFT_459235 [Calycina marina]|uniref:Uncharacterized protein n=1 Tax=Calycina marina TaxID=1763456 RepID=A0A9P7Z428_9HELO|nr:hypothetical protein BJ878DRAFT_459235 [Calycina marina]